VGVTVLPNLAASSRPGVAVRPVTGSSPMRRIYAATAAEAHCSAATDAMIEVLRAASERFERAAAA
jgi:DNA-binding transcriptional LysR family regulator